MTYKKTNKLSQLCISLIFLAGSLSVSANNNPSIDGIDLGLEQLLVVNKCNFTKSIGPDNEVLVELHATEVMSNPVVSIGQQNIPMTGAYNKWSAEFSLTSMPTSQYPTVAELQEEVKGFVASFAGTPASDIELFTTFSELGGADLAAALAAEYNIEISQEDQLDPMFSYGSLFERVLAAELPSVIKLKQVLAPYNKGIIEDNGGDVLDIPLAFLSLGTPSEDNKQTEEVIKEITTAFDIKTTQENIDEIVSADVPQYAWLDKIQSLEIPVTITYADTSGMVGNDVTLTSTDALRYCDDGVCQCFPEDISGQWQLRPKAGSMGVGRAEGNIGDWSATDFVWGTQRACLWDDEYIFKADKRY